MSLLKNFFNVGEDSGGQAALTDSLFFLAIVAMVCTLLFYFIINYGVSVEGQINSFYSADFAMDTLKVITYINVMRDGSSIYSLNAAGEPDQNPQYDYLLTMIKEDYSQTGAGESPSLNPSTKKAIANTVHTVMVPFEHSVDYAFYLFQEDSKQFLFLLMGLHEGVVVENEFNVDGSPKTISIRKMYYCLPPADSPRSATVLKDKVFPYIGRVDSAASKIFLARKEGGGANYVMELDLWVSKDVNSLRSLDRLPLGNDFNCAFVDRADYEYAPPAP